jgi:hypothetical protein
MAQIEEKPSMGPGVRKHTGGCHCGAVRYAVELDLAQGAARCNCSICTKIAQVSNAAKPAAFEVLSDPAATSVYEWGGRTMQRHFCRTCGVFLYGRGHLAELGGDYVAVNYNTIDGVDPWQLKVGYWDGRHDNWQSGLRETPWPIFR